MIFDVVLNQSVETFTVSGKLLGKHTSSIYFLVLTLSSA